MITYEKRICKTCKKHFEFPKNRCRIGKFCSNQCQQKGSIKNLIGEQSGYLTVIKRVGSDKWQSALWLCRCICGKEKIIPSPLIVKKRIKSCGCKRIEMITKKVTKHGLGDTRIYKLFYEIKNRCEDMSNPSYGGRGIQFLWKTFQEFYNDMNDSYEFHIKKFGRKNTTIDRIDNNGNYSTENCRWATKREQARNKRRNHLITFNKKTLSAIEWEEITGIRSLTIIQRISRQGWSPQEALTIPVRK